MLTRLRTMLDSSVPQVSHSEGFSRRRRPRAAAFCGSGGAAGVSCWTVPGRSLNPAYRDTSAEDISQHPADSQPSLQEMRRFALHWRIHNKVPQSWMQKALFWPVLLAAVLPYSLILSWPTDVGQVASHFNPRAAACEAPFQDSTCWRLCLLSQLLLLLFFVCLVSLCVAAVCYYDDDDDYYSCFCYYYRHHRHDDEDDDDDYYYYYYC